MRMSPAAHVHMLTGALSVLSIFPPRLLLLAQWSAAELGMQLAVSQVVMAPGNRADVLIRCASPTRLVLRSVSKHYNDGFLGHLTERYTGDLMYIDVVGEFTGNDSKEPVVWVGSSSVPRGSDGR